MRTELGLCKGGVSGNRNRPQPIRLATRDCVEDSGASTNGTEQRINTRIIELCIYRKRSLIVHTLCARANLNIPNQQTKGVQYRMIIRQPRPKSEEEKTNRGRKSGLVSSALTGKKSVKRSKHERCCQACHKRNPCVGITGL